MPDITLWGTMAVMALTASADLAPDNDSGVTPFSLMSKEAQNLIVGAICGEYDGDKQPEMSASVAAEIKEWADAPD